MADPSILNKPVYGTPKDFKHHLGQHLEQLALFALPQKLPTEDEQGDQGSNNAVPDLERNPNSLEDVADHPATRSSDSEDVSDDNAFRASPKKGSQESRDCYSRMGRTTNAQSN